MGLAKHLGATSKTFSQTIVRETQRRTVSKSQILRSKDVSLPVYAPM